MFPLCSGRQAPEPHEPATRGDIDIACIGLGETNINKKTIIAASVLLAACSALDGEQPAAQLPTDTLFLTDTVGVLGGDTCCIFGTVSDVIPVPEGFAVLDGIFCRISFYDREGNFIGSTGRRGEGPGEFSYPFQFCRLPGGEYLVYDQGAGSYTILDADLAYAGSYPSGTGLSLEMAPAGDSTVVISRIRIGFADGKLMVGCSIFSMNAFTGEEKTVYMEHIEEMGGSDMDLRPHFYFFTTHSSGRVYLARYDSDLYAIDVFSAGGDSLDRFLLERGPREEFDIETHRLRFLPITIPLSTNEGNSVLKVSAPELHPYVTALSTGPGDSIWVRRMGRSESEFWDVLSPEGLPARRVVLYADTTGSGASPSLHLSPWGMAATMHEYEVERFYIVE